VEPPADLRVGVTTPETGPIDYTWFVRGVIPGADLSETEVGWAMHQGFDIIQMPTTVIFPSVPTSQLSNVQVLMAISFTTDLLYETIDGKLEISLPNGFRVDCTSLKAFKLPLNPSKKCTVVEKGDSLAHIALGINEPMSGQSYAISFLVNTPPVTPKNNYFQLVLYDSKNFVQDSVTRAAGLTLKFGMPILADYKVFWQKDDTDFVLLLSKLGFDGAGTSLGGGSTPVTTTINGVSTYTNVTITDADISSFSTGSSTASSFNQVITNFYVEVGFRVVVPMQPTEGVYRIRIKYPKLVNHNKLQVKNGVGAFGVILSDNLSQRVNKIALFHLDELVLYVSPENRLLPIGNYTIKFPVTIPENDPLPAFNFYLLTFCKGEDAGYCGENIGGGFIMTYPLEGFQLLDPLPVRLVHASSAFGSFGISMFIFAIGLLNFLN